MRTEDIVVGKTYRVRSWSDLNANSRHEGIFMYDPEGSSDTSFVGVMRYMCGKNFTVKDVKAYPRDMSLSSVEGIEHDWCVCPWMLEEIEEEIIEPNGDLFGFLLQKGEIE